MAACKTFLMGKCTHFEGHIAHLEALRSPIVKTKQKPTKIKHTLSLSQTYLTRSLLHIIFHKIIDTSQNSNKLKQSPKFLGQSTLIKKKKVYLKSYYFDSWPVT